MSLASETTIYKDNRHIRGDEVRVIVCTPIGVHIYFKDDSKVVAYNHNLLEELNYQYANESDAEDSQPWALKE